MTITAALAALGGVVACLTIRHVVPVEPIVHSMVHEPCDHPSVRSRQQTAA